MKNIIFATNNRHKLDEVGEILGDKFSLSTPKERGILEDIPETSDTIEGNAIQKAMYIYEKLGVDCFADDTGLEVEALAGEPGVYSARYAGEPSDSEKNMDLLLKKLQGEDNREARFKTTIALVLDGQLYTFEGVVNGTISHSRRGDKGFGYDPIFVPDGYSESFAELGSHVKNRISHRALAVAKLVEFLKNRA